MSFSVWLLFSSRERIAGRWYVQHVAIWHWYLPFCAYIYMCVCVCVRVFVCVCVKITVIWCLIILFSTSHLYFFLVVHTDHT